MEGERIYYWDSSVFLAFLKVDEAQRANDVEHFLDEAEEGKVVIVTSSFTAVEVLKIKGNPVRLAKKDEQRICEFFQKDYFRFYRFGPGPGPVCPAL